MIKEKSVRFGEKLGPFITKGSLTDRDVVMRASGILNGESVYEVISLVEENGNIFEIKFDFQSSGEQLIDEASSYGSFEVIENANNYKLSSKKDVEAFANLVENGCIIFDDNSWIEAVVRVSQIRDGYKEEIYNNVESEIGLDGVWESVSDIEEFFTNESKRLDILNYIIKNLKG